MKFMKTFLITGILFVSFLLLPGLINNFSERKIYRYEYIDLNDNEGIANQCSYKFKEGRAGGQGSPICILNDGTVLQVKQYKKILVKTCVPAKDKDCGW